MAKLRYCSFFLCFLVTICAASTLFAQRISSAFLPRTKIARVGLERAWFAQIQVDRARSRILDTYLDEKGLFVITDSSVVHAIDANTGATLWSRKIGRVRHPMIGVTANSHYVAVVSGTLLSILNRRDGHVEKELKIDGVPSAGPGMTADRVFVPVMGGRIIGYKLAEDELIPWSYGATGKFTTAPYASEKEICWGSDNGHLFVAAIDDTSLEKNQMALRFRAELSGAIEAMPIYHKSYYIASTLSGYTYAISEKDGNHVWRFSTGSPIVQTPAVIGEQVYICPERGGMYCVNLLTGDQIWWSPKISHFIAATNENVYASDDAERLYILNAKSGAIRANLPAGEVDLIHANQTTDRILIGSRTGLIQCLHDETIADPKIYQTIVVANVDKSDKSEPAKAAAETAPAAGPDPTRPAEDPGVPAIITEPMPKPEPPPATENPFENAGGNDNPFAIP